ncbi:hypothetical protein [Flavobacterium xueshanense]|uniref:Uncharacterized protein n=1 Tax=Flavobacterium xueshanense TaxID=935223 RepID=A0A1I2EBK3_9FLAO|nr:hypothetical protein [Flavobacterium xueshanense]SFE90394.1 hypothetical protein SAMN04488131_105162 [Flavobacterium xueshanense]
MYKLELLQAINDWHSTGIGANKTQIAERIIEYSKDLPERFKAMSSNCYRQVSLTGTNSLILGANMKLPETYSSWTFDKSVVQNFNGGVPSIGYQGVIFEIHNNEPNFSIVINLYELYKEVSFLEACEAQKNEITSYKTGIGFFKNSEAEIILKVDNLTTSQIWAYGGYSAPREKLAEMYFGHVASQKELNHFDKLVKQTNTIIGGNWVKGTAKNRIVNLHISNAKRLTNRK